jgi:hypothetical protein
MQAPGQRRHIGRRTARLSAGRQADGAAEAMGEVTVGVGRDVQRLVDEAAIRQLSVNYALATDAIGRGEIEHGREVYRRTFTRDAHIRAGVAPVHVGPDAWVTFVHSVLSKYTVTQHLIGTLDVVLDQSDGGPPSSATMTTYLHASHVLMPGGIITVVLGTYFDDVIRTPDGWRIARRTLITVSSETRTHV